MDIFGGRVCAFSFWARYDNHLASPTIDGRRVVAHSFFFSLMLLLGERVVCIVRGLALLVGFSIKQVAYTLLYVER
jgi:hypothetical protein